MKGGKSTYEAMGWPQDCVRIRAVEVDQISNVLSLHEWLNVVRVDYVYGSSTVRKRCPNGISSRSRMVTFSIVLQLVDRTTLMRKRCLKMATIN